MVTGIEVAGLALAALPLLANQLDGYVLQIERLWRWRRYRREFAHYSTLFGAQHAILLNTLEEVLIDIVGDEERVSELLRHPINEGWNNPDLERGLRERLGRSYHPFLGTMTSLFNLLSRLSEIMGISLQDMRTGSQPEARRRWRLLLGEPVYRDLLGRIDEANTILKALLERPRHQEQTQRRQHIRNYLLPRYKMAEELFKRIVKGWACDCGEHHSVHFQLQSNPLRFANGHSAVSEPSKFRITFSRMDDEDATDSWGREIEFVDWPKGQVPPPPVIQDLCASLHVTETHIETRQLIGVLSCETNQYAMHAKSFQLPVPTQSLQQILSRLSRRERLRIAAGLACCVMQLYGNWLKAPWNSSDIHLEGSSDNRSDDSALMDLFVFTWSLSTPDSQEDRCSALDLSTSRRDILMSLGLALVELSVGRSAEDVDDEVTTFETARKLVDKTESESGSNYADAVHSCLFFSDRRSLCSEENSFQDHVCDKIISPLLRDLLHFEGLRF